MNNLNVRLYEALYEWDPFQIGKGNYDPEFADIIQAVHEFDDVYKLVNRIQEIFQFSFEQIPSKKENVTMATQLINMKNDESCTLN
ncbi:hypothetical protein JOC85_002189 [Bacillus mesophilus]|uniref:DUF1871 family protein n=1 Tax=Bacillus mesophilus TaxID=1808955 RepID=A0A6M0Q8J1_9BACI|nr:DUF1871 family protein [Bacillus mesophilus]MBM7661386.1 hypothetical protein [Bacillus mesophilus]NEY72059.1 DUF1871 family protein [Bacillus mesophilus]